MLEAANGGTVFLDEVSECHSSLLIRTGVQAHAARRRTTKAGPMRASSLAESHERRVQAVENAIVEAPAKRRAATKTVLDSLTPFVAVVQSTHPRQCNDSRRG